MTIEELIDKTERSDISSTRSALNRILTVINNANTGAFDLKSVIEMDPPLAARVLKRANSAFYGLNRRLDDILEAIVCIGFEAVRELALNQTVCELFQNDDEVFGYSRSSLWIHCVATALCGKMIFRREFQLSGEKAYTVGLLHDIGIIVEDQFARPQFMQALEMFTLEPALGLYECERKVFDFTHADVGLALARAWNFPDELCCSIGTEEPTPVVESDADLLMTTLCAARWACQARQIGFVETPGKGPRPLRSCLQRLNIAERGLEFIMDEVVSQIELMRDEGWF